MAVEKTIKLRADVAGAVSEVERLKTEVQQTDQAAQASDVSFDHLGTTIDGVGVSLKALGIGLVVAALVKLRDMFSQNQVVMDAVNTVSETINAIFLKLTNTSIELVKKMTSAFKDPEEAVRGLWTAIKQNLSDRLQGLIDGFGALGKVIKGVFTRDLDLIKEGLDSAAVGLVQLGTGMTAVEQSNFADNLKTTAKELKKTVTDANDYAKSLVELREEVKLAEANQRQLQLTYQKDAEIQRQIRDNTSLTLDERIEANNKLAGILDKQFEEEKALAQKKIDLAQMEADQNKDNVDLQVALINAQTDLADLEERITGQRSENLVNETALQQEKEDAINKTQIAEQNRLDLEKQAGQLNLEFQKNLSDEELKLLIKTEKDKIKIREDRIKAVKQMEIGAAKNILSSLGQLAGEGTKTAKAAALAGILIDTSKGISGAIAAGAGIPFPANLGAIATGVATVLAGIAQAKSIFAKAPGGGGEADVPDSTDAVVGGGGGGGGLGITVPNMEAITQPTLGEPAPIQAYVIENDISDAQALQEELETQATL